MTKKENWLLLTVLKSKKKIDLENIKAILFDLDGVLIDSLYAWFSLFNATLIHFGYKPITEEVFRRHWGQSTEEDVRIFMPGTTLDEVRDYFLNHYVKYLSYLKLNPHARKILEELTNLGLKLGCVTNSHRDIVKKILKKHDFINFFQAIVTADDVTNPKPAPDILFEACKILNVVPGEAIFLGDTQTDTEAGERAGCFIVGYRTDARMRVEDLQEFYRLLTTS